MARQYEEKETSYYYDLHPTKEDLMGETAVHRAVVTYLTLVLQWLFREQRRLTQAEAEARLAAERRA